MNAGFFYFQNPTTLNSHIRTIIKTLVIVLGVNGPRKSATIFFNNLLFDWIVKSKCIFTQNWIEFNLIVLFANLNVM